MSRLTFTHASQEADTTCMRRWVRLILATVTVTVWAFAALIGVDWLWHTVPGSTPVAAVVGDPRIQVRTTLPDPPPRAAIYRTATRITAEELQAVIPGEVRAHDGWLDWKGRSPLAAVTVMDRLNPGIPWRAHKGSIGPAPKDPAFGIDTAGMSSAFTGTDVVSTSFGYYRTNGGWLTYLSVPAHRIAQDRSVKLISATVALLDLHHHRSNSRLLSASVPLLPERWTAGDEIQQLGPITDVRLVHAQDPADPARSKPVWVFDPIGEVDARR